MTTEMLLIGSGIHKYRELLGSRYETLLYAFNSFEAIGGKVVVELGTSRSFVPYGQPGWMQSDCSFWDPDKPEKWDWSAGLFTRVCAEHFAANEVTIHSVDFSLEAIEISRTITSGFASRLHYHCQSSVEFLSQFPGNIDLLYMDTGGLMTGADRLQYQEAQIIVRRKLMSHQGLILVDDVNVPGKIQSKGKYSLPFLKIHGFAVRREGYQVCLQNSEQNLRLC